MISVNGCLISLIVHNGEYFDIRRKVSQSEGEDPGPLLVSTQQLEIRDR